MKKENIVTSKVGELPGCLTRSKAAVLRASGQLPPLKPTKQVPKPCRANPKRAAAPDKTCVPRKKRAVLRDVTNVTSVLCENSYMNCFNATKIQAKKSKLSKSGQVNISKVVPLASVEPPQLQTSRSSPQPLISQKAKRSCLSELLSASTNPDVVDVDADHEDPQLCSDYAPDIYENLRVFELARRPGHNFMETVQRDITQGMRGILVDWLVEVSEEYKLVPDTLYLTVYLIDWFLSNNYIERQRLQLLGITCMLIASKYEEICPPRIEEFCFMTDNTYTKDEVLKMEIQVLKCCKYQLFAPTTKSFLRRFLRAAQASYKSPSIELEYLANYLAELSLMDYGFLSFLPSITAASAVFLARWTINQSYHPWNPTLEYYSSYKASDLKTTVFALQDLQMNTTGCPLSAVRMKYRQDKVLMHLKSSSLPQATDTCKG